MNNIINYKQICDIYNNGINDEQMKTWLSKGFNFIVNSVALSENYTTLEQVADCKDLKNLYIKYFNFSYN